MEEGDLWSIRRGRFSRAFANIDKQRLIKEYIKYNSKNDAVIYIYIYSVTSAKGLAYCKMDVVWNC